MTKERREAIKKALVAHLFQEFIGNSWTPTTGTPLSTKELNTHKKIPQIHTQKPKLHYQRMHNTSSPTAAKARWIKQFMPAHTGSNTRHYVHMGSQAGLKKWEA